MGSALAEAEELNHKKGVVATGLAAPKECVKVSTKAVFGLYLH